MPVAFQLLTPVVAVATTTSSSATFIWNTVLDATSYQVSVNGGAFTIPSSGAVPNDTTHTVTGLSAGQTLTVAVRALGSLYCETSDTAGAYIFIPSTAVFIPNTFTPNGDGRNDRFQVYGKGIISLDLQIFSQWGEKVFASKDVTGGWDGTFKGEAQPVGVYVYMVNVVLRDGSKVSRKGTINLIR